MIEAEKVSKSVCSYNQYEIMQMSKIFINSVILRHHGSVGWVNLIQ